MTEASPDGPGLQFERTGLAHVRTTLAFAVVGLLVVRSAEGTGERLLISTATLLAIAVVAGVGHVRRRELRGQTSAVRPIGPAAITVALLVLQVCAVVLTL